MASEIRIDKVSAAGATSDLVLESAGGDVVLGAPGGRVKNLNPEAGMVIGYAYVRSDAEASYSVTSAKPGVEVTPLSITITPKFANSLIHVEWTIFGEGSTHNHLWRLTLNGVQPSDAYNTEAGDVAWSGLDADRGYDPDHNSTPKRFRLNYVFIPGSTAPQTLVPTITRSSSTSTWRLNRAYGSSGTTSYERAPSWGFAWEVAQ